MSFVFKSFIFFGVSIFFAACSSNIKEDRSNGACNQDELGVYGSCVNFSPLSLTQKAWTVTRSNETLFQTVSFLENGVVHICKKGDCFHTDRKQIQLLYRQNANMLTFYNQNKDKNMSFEFSSFSKNSNIFKDGNKSVVFKLIE